MVDRRKRFRLHFDSFTLIHYEYEKIALRVENRFFLCGKCVVARGKARHVFKSTAETLHTYSSCHWRRVYRWNGIQQWCKRTRCLISLAGHRQVFYDSDISSTHVIRQLRKPKEKTTKKKIQLELDSLLRNPKSKHPERFQRNEQQATCISPRVHEALEDILTWKLRERRTTPEAIYINSQTTCTAVEIGYS